MPKHVDDTGVCTMNSAEHLRFAKMHALQLPIIMQSPENDQTDLEILFRLA